MTSFLGDKFNFKALKKLLHGRGATMSNNVLLSLLFKSHLKLNKE